jgi:Ca2+-binding EF-hand superfamily protein
MKPPCLVLAAAALLSTAAFAQTETAAPQANDAAQSSAFKALDKDQNGSISTEEAQAAPVVARSFSSADKNHDGTLSREEFDGSFTIAPPAAQDAPAAPEPSPPPR